MTEQNQNSIPRGMYGLLMLGMTMIALAATWGVARGVGGDSKTSLAALGALSFASFATFVPALFSIRKEHWGIAVMVSGVARCMLALGVCYFLRERGAEVMARPMFLGVVTGAGILLVAETTACIRILSKLERRREQDNARASAHQTTGIPA